MHVLAMVGASLGETILSMGDGECVLCTAFTNRTISPVMYSYIKCSALEGNFSQRWMLTRCETKIRGTDSVSP